MTDCIRTWRARQRLHLPSTAGLLLLSALAAGCASIAAKPLDRTVVVTLDDLRGIGYAISADANRFEALEQQIACVPAHDQNGEIGDRCRLHHGAADARMSRSGASGTRPATHADDIWRRSHFQTFSL